MMKPILLAGLLLAAGCSKQPALNYRHCLKLRIGIAIGDVIVDQLPALRRSGFDSFAPQVPLDPADADAAFGRWPHVYQADAIGSAPIWKLRHG